jgi:MerR family transcriptional regulator, light-induced transcriptional regulator
VLGVSASTIKRWVDSGTIGAVRTRGKHRLIPMSEALRLARDRGIRPVRIEGLADLGSGRTHEIDDRTRHRLYRLLRDGKVVEAKALILSLHAAGPVAAELADNPIRPAMERIGHGWMVGALDVFQEHEATNAVASCFLELIDRAVGSDENNGPIARGATTEGDPYLLSLLLGELVLREVGYRVPNLGTNLPLRSLSNAILQHRPRLIFLSINCLQHADRFVGEYLSFHQAATAANAAVILGGQALCQELRCRLGYTAFGDRLAHLAEFARRLSRVSPAGSTSGPTHSVDMPAS